LIRDVASKRYAEAAHLIAREEGTEEAWSDGLRAMSALYSDPDAAAFLLSSRVPPKEKQALVQKALEGVQKEVLSLALILLRRGRTSLGPGIVEAYQELLDEARGVSHATVTTAVTLSDEELEAVKKKLSEIAGGEVVVQTEVDEEILGGVVVRIGDRLIDGSTKGRLLALKQRLAGARA
jgi:F-type H+-transporting ATPase subunit delta